MKLEPEPTLAEVLESIVDREGLGRVLTILASIAENKAENPALDSWWKAAWKYASNRIGKTATFVHSYRI